MQYDVNTPAEYLKALDLDWRKDKLLELRSIILKQDADIEESINYKMLCYRLNGAELLHLNAQKGTVSLYCGNIEKVDPDGVLLNGLNLGKGCIRLSKTKDVVESGVAAFIARAVRLRKDGMDLSC